MQLSAPIGGAPSLLSAGKPLALLLFLSAAPNRTASRGALISLLWSDLEPDAAKHALRQTIWYLRKKTGQELVLSEANSIQLIDGVAVDRDALLDASKAGDHQRVVDLYSGPFVPSFAAPGGAGFEEWASLERRRLLEVFRHSAEALIATQLATGRARDAIVMARRLRDQDVYNEGGWRLLIEACVSAGDLLAAKAEAAALLQLADREEITLETATHSAIRAIRPTNSSAAPASESPISTLVGREEVFASLLRAWEDTRRGDSTRVHLTARAGIGKTRLLRDLATRLRAMRSRVIMVGGSLGMRDVEYALAGELAAGLASLPGRQAIAPESAATLVELNPSLSTWFDRPPRHTLREDLLRARTLAVRELLAAVSFEHPVAVLIDDVHWWDDASTTLIAAAVEGIGDSRVLLVTAGRPESRLSPLLVDTGTTQVELEPLTAVQGEELLLSIASLPLQPWTGGFANELWRASRGSPLLALEMLQHLEELQLLQRMDGRWETERSDALIAELQQGDVLRTRLLDLDRADLWLLTLLATAGSTLATRVIVDASERSHEEVLERMSALEGRGFVVRHGEGWRSAHDEISEEVLRLAPSEASPRAAARLGRTLAAPPIEESRARRAAQLLRLGPDVTALADLFRLFSAHRYALGDRRSVEQLAVDLLGATARPSEVAELHRGAPLSWRLGLVSSARRAVAAVGGILLIAIAGLAFTARSAPPPPDAELGLAFVDSAGRVTFERVSLRAAAWSPQDTLVSEPWPEFDLRLASANGFNVDFSPTTKLLVTAQAVQDSGTIDLFLSAAGMQSRPFLPAIRDDFGPTFSPDGRLVAFSTARWDSLMHYDLAVAALEDTAPQRLTQGPGSDDSPRWSPDGSRIAFERSNWGERANELCVIELSTRDLQCRSSSAPRGRLTPLGWYDLERIVVRTTTETSAHVGVMQWSSGDIDPITEGDAHGAIVSPDASWAVCRCGLASAGTQDYFVFPLTAPHLTRAVRITTSGTRELMTAFWISSRASLLPASVAIQPQPTVQAGVPAQMRAVFRDGRGNSLNIRGGVRWRVRNPNEGTIDSLRGIVIASGNSSSVTLQVATGPGVSDSIVVRVSVDSAALAFEEEWRNGLHAWWPFGFPAPSVESSDGAGPRFLNNGEGSFESGVASRRDFDPSRGVAIDMDVSTPITLGQWQVIGVALREFRDTLALKAAANVNAMPLWGHAREWCAMGYPLESRFAGRSSLGSLQVRDQSSRVGIEGVADGRWWRLRLQLFPDGRCGLAVNGTPIGLVDAGAPPTGRLRVMILGNSFRTRIAVGRVRVYEGVLRDVDWASAGR